MQFTSTLISALSLVSLSSAHCLISAASGDLGGKGQGLGVTAAGKNQQNDVTVFKASAGAFGETALGGNNVLATGLTAQQKITGATIPQISSTAGVVNMTLHQINGDGAGPMACSVSADASGKTFVAMKVTTQVPGTNGKSNAANTDFPLVADMPAGTACTGTVGALKNVCAVKCANPAGPFGGIVLVQQAAAGGNAGASAAAPVASAAAGAKAGKGSKASNNKGAAKASATSVAAAASTAEGADFINPAASNGSGGIAAATAAEAAVEAAGESSASDQDQTPPAAKASAPAKGAAGAKKGARSFVGSRAARAARAMSLL